MSDAARSLLVEKCASITTKQDFVEFLRLLVDDCRTHSQSWPNSSLDAFLDGLLGFVQDIEGFHRNAGLKVDLVCPSWRLFADSLLAARVYE